jgi:hypothetical protein
MDGFNLVEELLEVGSKVLEFDAFDLATVVSVMAADVVGVVCVVVPEEFFVGWAEVLEAVFESLRELIAFRDVPGECFPAVTGWEFIVVLEYFPRWHPSTCVVHIGQHT